MISYSVYKLVHITGAFLLYAALGAMALGSAEGLVSDRTAARKLVSMGHGIALVVILVGGFGTLARLGISSPFPLWVWIKLAIWVAMGGLVVLIRKMPAFAKAFFWLTPLLGALAAYMAIYKPGSGSL